VTNEPLLPATRHRPGIPSAIATAVVIVAAALLVVILDIAHQPADPPRDLSSSTGVLDEGIWSHNAVNDALFGRARIDDFNPMYVSAGSVLYRVSYGLFGVGIRQTRLPSIAFAGLTVLIVGFLLWREDHVAGAVGGLLLGTSWLYLSYSRLGLLETPAAAIAACGLGLVVWGLHARRAWLGSVGGGMLAAAIAVKPQVAAAVVGAFSGLAVWTIIHRGERRGRSLIAAAGGFLVIGTAWAVFVLSHLDPATRSEWRWHSSGILPKLGQVVADVRTYLGSSDGVGTRARPLLIAAAAGLVLQAAAWAWKKRVPSALAFAGAGWALAALTVVSALPYTPSRYAVLSLPGLAITAGCGVMAARALVPARALIAFVTAVIALTAIAGAVGIRAWADWARAPEFGVRETAQMLERETRPGDVIYGGWAMLASIEAGRLALVAHAPDINDRCPIERFAARWVFANEGDRVGRAELDAAYPGLLLPKNRVATATILGRRLVLYRVPPGLKGAGCS
jgi:hypothetical protein